MGMVYSGMMSIPRFFRQKLLEGQEHNKAGTTKTLIRLFQTQKIFPYGRIQGWFEQNL
jgi:hypothetical protein